MNKFLLLFSILTLSFTSLYAQYSVKGEVVDSVGTGEAFATIRIFKSDNKAKPVRLGTTDANGIFSQSVIEPGKYSISISSVGKTTLDKEFEISKGKLTFDFGKLVIKDAATSLGEVTVTAQRPLIKQEIDRLSYDVQADDESKTSTIFDMLKKVPYVTVDGQENIKVKGSSDFKIYKNGKPNTSWEKNPKDVLKSIPASMIKRIEVITEPGAKYDAEGVGGILNIITTDNSSLAGVVGSVNASLGNYWNPQIGGYLMTQFGKFTTSINYGYSKFGNKDEVYRSITESNYVKSGSKSMSNLESRNPGYIHYGNIEASYEIDTLNLVTMSFGGYFYNINTSSLSDEKMFANNGDLTYSYTSYSFAPKYRYFDFNGKIDYQHLTSHKDETITLSYLLSTTNQTNNTRTEYSDLVNFPLDYEWQTYDNKLKFFEHTFQFDWTRPFAKIHKIEMGAKYILRTNNSQTNQSFSKGDDKNTDFSHTTHVGAMYGEYSVNTTHWGARAGLRYELSRLNGKFNDNSAPNFGSTLNDVVPTLSVNYKINDANSFKLNYSTRIRRPGIAYLNPAVTSSPYSVSYGNPNLKSVRINSGSLSYSLIKPKIILTQSASFSITDKLLQSVKTVENDVTYSTYENAGKYRSLRFSTYLQWTITPKTSAMLNGSINYNKYANDNLGLTNSGWSWNAFARITQELPFKINASLYLSRYNWGINDVYDDAGNSQWDYSVYLRRSFLKENRLSVSAGFSNLFFTKYATSRSNTINGDLRGTNTNWYPHRRFNISISYRFGSLKASVKKANKTIENEDLQGRK